ncbi:MAG: hypothetical protein ACOYJA_10970 [Christensenellales bacterium]|jgi:hypothetical protein
MEIYFPSCNYAKAHPQTAKRIMDYMRRRMPVAGCCRYDRKAYGPEDCGIVNCQACREVLAPKLAIRSIWEFLDAQEDFPWPDYQGLTVNLQDCWRDRHQPQVHRAVRSLLGRMGVSIVEIAQNRERATFCGNLHVEPQDPENLRRLQAYPDVPVYELPGELERALMREQAAQYTCAQVVCTCNRCEQGIRLGGAQAVHLMDLVFPPA